MADMDELIKKAVAELGIDVPVLSARLKGNELELFLLYGNRLVYHIEGQEKTSESAHQPLVGEKKKIVKRSKK